MHCCVSCVDPRCREIGKLRAGLKQRLVRELPWPGSRDPGGGDGGGVGGGAGGGPVTVRQEEEDKTWHI